MPDYSKGQIYKIVDVGQTKCYIGSTTQPLSVRMAGHRKAYKRYTEGNDRRYTSVYQMFNEFGVENCKIVWIKDFASKSKKELEAEEGRIQQETECVNKRVAGRVYEEWYRTHREEESERKKQYRKNNPELMKEQAKEQYKRHRDKKLAPYNCECGSTVVYDCKARHIKSKKHQQYIQNQQNPQE